MFDKVRIAVIMKQNEKLQALKKKKKKKKDANMHVTARVRILFAFDFESFVAIAFILCALLSVLEYRKSMYPIVQILQRILIRSVISANYHVGNES